MLAPSPGYDARMPGIAPPRYRLPDSAHVGRVTLEVGDLRRSLAFYRDLIGFRELEREGPLAAGTVELGAQKSADVLLVLREKPGARPVSRRGLLGLYHFALLLPNRADLGRFIRHVDAAGVSAGAADHLVSEALYLTDPDGLQMEVYADRPRETWGVRGGELVMAVDPLDVSSLVSAAGEEAWSGVPTGSTIGHMHFYVGDLAQAEAFYHAAIGFDKVVWNFPGALFISAGGYHHHVGLNTWAAGSPVATAADARLAEWRLVLPDASGVAAVRHSLETAGFQVRAHNGDAVAEDPWGIRVRLACTA